MAHKSSDVTFGNAAEGVKLVGANVQFALDLYRHLSLTTSGNIFMSPLSISIALAMTYHGARNNTKSQMSSVLHFGDVSETDLHQLFSDIRLALNKPGQPFKLFIANRLFGEKSYNFLEEYLLSSDKYYGAKLEPLNFR
jgi:serine protease inhibitor